MSPRHIVDCLLVNQRLCSICSPEDPLYLIDYLDLRAVEIAENNNNPASFDSLIYLCQSHEMSFLFGGRSSKIFKPKKNIPEETYQYDWMKHAAATLGNAKYYDMGVIITISRSGYVCCCFQLNILVSSNSLQFLVRWQATDHIFLEKNLRKSNCRHDEQHEWRTRQTPLFLMPQLIYNEITGDADAIILGVEFIILLGLSKILLRNEIKSLKGEKRKSISSMSWGNILPVDISSSDLPLKLTMVYCANRTVLSRKYNGESVYKKEQKIEEMTIVNDTSYFTTLSFVVVPRLSDVNFDHSFLSCCLTNNGKFEITK
ncbi:MOB kinase activator-like 1 [Nymphon striatum]|nr:MOB kinase activator-like 1 [Nymphon striatum]